jgi:ATP-dependent phosphofructokinase / diphosphate-dependent phosphofructokinase
MKRIGLLTGGGDAPGLNAVIRAIVKSAVFEYGWDVVGIEDGFEGLIHNRTRPLGVNEVRGILPRGGTILGTTNRANPFRYQVEINGQMESLDRSDLVVENAAALGIEVLLVVGGDGTLRLAHEMSDKGLPVVAVPKTIDNDILHTDFSFGFDTAVNTAMEALDRLHTTAESHHRIMILEVMGRDAGWIALRAGIAGGADVILIPEIPFQVSELIEKIERRDSRGAKFSIIVAAEGARPHGGEMVYQQLSAREGGAPPRLGGIGEQLAEELRLYTHKDVRVTVLGHLQRGGSPTAFDRLLGTRFGSMAVHMAAEGRLDQMVALQGEELVFVPILEAASGQKFVPVDSDIIRAALRMDITLGMDSRR